MNEKRNLKNKSNQNTLIAELAERRRALSEIRATAYKIVAAVSAAGITLFWLMLTECSLSFLQIIMLNFFIVALFFFVWSILSSLHNGFQANRKIMVSIETELGLYDINILPQEYKNTKVRKSDFLLIVKRFVIFMALSLIIVSWCKYCFCDSAIICSKNKKTVRQENKSDIPRLQEKTCEQTANKRQHNGGRQPKLRVF